MLTKIQAGEMIAVTFEGKEIAKLVPPDYSVQAARKKLDQLRKTAFVGDVVSPLGEKWEAAESLLLTPCNHMGCSATGETFTECGRSHS